MMRTIIENLFWFLFTVAVFGTLYAFWFVEVTR